MEVRSSQGSIGSLSRRYSRNSSTHDSAALPEDTTVRSLSDVWSFYRGLPVSSSSSYLMNSTVYSLLSQRKPHAGDITCCWQDTATSPGHLEWDELHRVLVVHLDPLHFPDAPCPVV